MKPVNDGYELQVGDIIVSKSAFGKSRFVVHRVTKKFAFVKYNDVAEGKFPRVYDWSFQVLPKAKYKTTEYTVYTKRESS